jgi:hypothetical protein
MEIRTRIADDKTSLPKTHRSRFATSVLGETAMPERRSLKTLLNQERDNFALVIGNGINIHGAGNRNSWERLLVQIAHHCAVDVPSVPKGTALTEFYDVLEMKRSSPTTMTRPQPSTSRPNPQPPGRILPFDGTLGAAPAPSYQHDLGGAP